MIITDKAQIKCYELIESDLKLPADATFTRSSVAYLSDGTQVDVNTPRFEQGKFGKAIMVEEGTENLLPANKANCEVAPDSTAYATVTIDTSRKLVGSGSLKVQWDGDGSVSYSFVQYNITLTNGNTYTVSGWVYAEESKYLRLSVQESASPWRVFNTGLVLIPAKQWTRLSVTFTLPSDWTQPSRIQPNSPRNSTTLSDFATIPAWWDAIQVEQKPYATSFTDGTRTAESLTIPTAGVLNPQEGTVEVTYIPSLDSSKVALGSAGQDWWWIFGAGSALDTNELRLAYASGSWRFRVGRGSDTTYSMSFAAGDKISLALAWKQGVDARFFINGVKVATFTPYNFDVGTIISIGYSYLWNRYYCNGLIDDLRISNRARTDEEILAAYQSGKPLLADEWTTYKLDFDDKVRITAQGQIICNELIEI